MRLSVFVLVVANLCSCVQAMQLKKPVLYPSTLAVSFGCDEEELVRGVERIERDAAASVINCRAQQKAAEMERDKAKADAASEKSWALVGKLESLGIVAGAIVAAIAVLANAFGGSNK